MTSQWNINGIIHEQRQNPTMYIFPILLHEMSTPATFTETTS